MNAAVYFHDNVYVRICDLPDCSAIFGSDILYHGDCLRCYIRQYERAFTKNEVKMSEKRIIFLDVIPKLDDFMSGKGISLSLIRDECNLKL